MRHLVIGQRQKAPNFSAFHWAPHSCLITIGQHFVTTRVAHLPKRTETSLITGSDRSRPNHQILQLCTVCTAWSDSDQAVRAVHSCKSWFLDKFLTHENCLCEAVLLRGHTQYHMFYWVYRNISELSWKLHHIWSSVHQTYKTENETIWEWIIALRRTFPLYAFQVASNL